MREEKPLLINFLIELFLKARNYINVFYRYLFFMGAWYWFPFKVIVVVFVILSDILGARINFRFKKFQCWDEFEEYLLDIIHYLEEKDYSEWASVIKESLYVSELSDERTRALLTIMPVLAKQKFVRKLGLQANIERAVQHLKAL